MMRYLLAVLTLSFSSCGMLAGRLTELEANFAETLAGHAEANQAAIDEHKAATEASVEALNAGLISTEKHVENLRTAGAERDDAFGAAFEQFKDDAAEDRDTFREGVTEDWNATKETVVNAASGVLGMGPIGDLVGAVTGAFGLTMGVRGASRKKSEKKLANKIANHVKDSMGPRTPG